MRRLLRVAFAALLLVLAPAASAQNWFHIFASANRDPHSSFKQAQRQLASEQQANLLAVLDRLYCGLPRRNMQFLINSSIGEYKHSAEASAELDSVMDVPTARYAAAILGLYEKQESVLLFREDDKGPDTEWLLVSADSHSRYTKLKALHKVLAKSGLDGWTLIVGGRGFQVKVVDIGSSRGEKLGKLAKTLGAELHGFRGGATLLGGDTPEQGAELFRREIESYEQKHPAMHFSQQIASGEFARAKGITCTIVHL